MTTNAHRESATIYVFPTGGRVRSAASAAQIRFAAEAAAVGVSKAVCTGNWYHDEAIHEAEINAKH